MEVRLSGRDVDEVFALADEVKAELAAIPGTKNVRDDWGLRTKKLVVRIDQPRAQRAGLSSQDVALSLQTVLTGFETTQYREDDKVIPVTLRSVAAERTDLGKLESHNIFSQSTGNLGAAQAGRRHRGRVPAGGDLPARPAEDGHDPGGRRSGA